MDQKSKTKQKFRSLMHSMEDCMNFFVEIFELPDLQGYEPPNKKVTINSLKKTWQHRK